MPKARHRSLTLGLELRELTMHNLAVDDDWFEVAELILALALLVPATKEVDALLNRVTLHTIIPMLDQIERTYLALEHLLRILLSQPCVDYAAAGTLDERGHA